MAVYFLRNPIIAVLSLFIAPAWADSVAPKFTPEMANQGKSIFQANCVTCHGANADGNGPAGKYMSPRPRDLNRAKFKGGDSAANIYKTITQGLDGTAMPGFGSLSDSDRWALVSYIDAIRKP